MFKLSNAILIAVKEKTTTKTTYVQVVDICSSSYVSFQ